MWEPFNAHFKSFARSMQSVRFVSCIFEDKGLYYFAGMRVISIVWSVLRGNCEAGCVYEFKSGRCEAKQAPFLEHLTCHDKVCSCVRPSESSCTCLALFLNGLNVFALLFLKIRSLWMRWLTPRFVCQFLLTFPKKKAAFIISSFNDFF